MLRKIDAKQDSTSTLKFLTHVIKLINAHTYSFNLSSANTKFMASPYLSMFSATAIYIMQQCKERPAMYVK